MGLNTEEFSIHDITDQPELIFNKDPVRPELDMKFKTSKGRKIFGLKDSSDSYVAFVCVAYTDTIPTTVRELDDGSAPGGKNAIPYTVWSYKKGSGRIIINKLIELSNNVSRIVTLSPKTEMAQRFHIRNGAIKVGSNKDTANFEYLKGRGNE